MAHRTPPPQKPQQPDDWRGPRRGAARQAAGQGDVGTSRVVATWLKLGAAVVLLAALGLWLYQVLVPMHRTVPLLMFVVTEYDAPLPPNAWAREDAARFAAVWQRSKDRDVEVGTQSQEGSWKEPADFLRELGERLKSARPGGPNKDMVLVYLSAHGLLDDDGRPCLALATPAERTSGTPPVAAPLPALVPIQDVLETIRDSRPRKSHVVVFLDAGRIATNWQLGILYNGFADELPGVLRTVNDPALALINSAGPGQVAWTLPELKCSAFGLAVCQGLQGQAAEGKRGQVSLQQLRTYLETTLERLVRDAYSTTQVPQYLGPESDLPLAFAAPAIAPLPTADKSELGHGQAELQALWQKHETLAPQADAGVALNRRQVLSLEALQQGLLRLEQLREAGSAYAVTAEELQTDLKNLAAKLEAHEATAEPAAPSLALAVHPSTSQQAVLSKRIREHLPSAEKDAQPLTDLTPDERAWAVWDWGSREATEVRPALADRMLALAGTRQPKGERQPVELPEFVELRTLRQFRANGCLPEAVRDNGRLLKLALTCRQQAETAAAASKELLAWDSLHEPTAQGDEARRQGEDRLFTGQVKEAQASFEAAGQAYRLAQQLELQLAQALATRDRVWLEAPGYLQWALARRSKDNVQACLDLLRGTDQLASRLRDCAAQGRTAETPRESGGGPDAQQVVAELAQEAQRLTGILQTLHKGFARDIENVIQRPEDRATLLLTRQLLATPLVTGKQRERLWSTVSKALRGGQAAEAVGSRARPAAAAEPTAETQPTAFWLELPAAWPHPASFLVGRREPPPAGGDASGTRDENNREARLRLLSLRTSEVRQTLRNLLAATGPLGGPEVPADTKPAWAAREQAARAAQAAASLLCLSRLTARGGQPEQHLRDPVGALWRFYRAEFWNWQAQRLLDDFQGNFGEDGIAAGAPPYFARVAEPCLERSEKLCRPPLTGKTRGLLQTRVAAAQAWVTATADKVVLRPQDRAFPLTAKVQLAEDLPRGEVAMFVEDATPQRAGFQCPPGTSDAAFGEVHALPTATALQDLALRCRLGSPDRAPDGSDWAFRFFYRGHYSSRKVFSVELLERGQLAFWNRPQYPAPKLEVQGTTQPGTVAIVLDCSQSMGDNDRLPNALAALRTMLDELKDQGGFSVSLWLFGHRRGLRLKANTPDTVQLFWNPKWPTPDAADIRLENDVERIWQSDDFSVQTVGDKKELRTEDKRVLEYWLNTERTPIVACGRTPLHWAMIRAIKDHLRDAKKPGPRRLIILSDGGNLVRDPVDAKVKWEPEWKYVPSFDKSVQEVADALQEANRQPGERVGVVLISDEHSDYEDMLRALREQLIRDPEGSRSSQFASADFKKDPDKLRRELRRSLGLYRYSVLAQPDTGGGAERPEQPLNTRWELPAVQDGLKKYAVHLHFGAGEPLATANLAASGGEAFVLKVLEEAKGPRLVHERYTRAGDTDVERYTQQFANPAPAARDADYNPAEFFVAAHPATPAAGGGGVLFPVSVQNGDPRRFSPRPAEVWAEILPQPEGAPFVFYDVDFEAGQPVPVLKFMAHGWPATAPRARLQMWFKLEPTPATESRQIFNVRREREDDFAVQVGQPPLRFAVQVRRIPEGTGRGYEVAVLEAHDPAGPPAAAKVELTPPPSSLARQYYPKLGRVEHVFRYPDKSEDEVNKAWLRITPVAELKKDAAKFELRETLLVRP